MNCDGFDFTHIEKKQIDWIDSGFLIENIEINCSNIKSSLSIDTVTGKFLSLRSLTSSVI